LADWPTQGGTDDDGFDVDDLNYDDHEPDPSVCTWCFLGPGCAITIDWGGVEL
jgi:hypothetical protein